MALLGSKTGARSTPCSPGTSCSDVSTRPSTAQPSPEPHRHPCPSRSSSLGDSNRVNTHWGPRRQFCIGRPVGKARLNLPQARGIQRLQDFPGHSRVSHTPRLLLSPPVLPEPSPAWPQSPSCALPLGPVAAPGAGPAAWPSSEPPWAEEQTPGSQGAQAPRRSLECGQRPWGRGGAG